MPTVPQRVLAAAFGLLLAIVCRPASALEHKTTIRLAAGPIDCSVRCPPDAERVGLRLLNMSAKALPLIERAIGVPYPRPFGVAIVIPDRDEEVGGTEAYYGDAGVIAARRTARPWVIVHELCHAWCGTQWFTERWLLEGWANLYTYIVLRDLREAFDPQELLWYQTRLFVDYSGPYDPPLSEWAPPFPIPSSWTSEDYRRSDVGYGKALAFSYLLYRQLGLIPLQQVNMRILREAQERRVGSRDLLRIVEQVTGKPQGDTFSGWVFRGPYRRFQKRDFNDRDNDGLFDFEEILLGTHLEYPDTDQDGLLDGDEVEFGTDPLRSDTRGDGLLDGAREIACVVDGSDREWRSDRVRGLPDPPGDALDGIAGADLTGFQVMADERFLYLDFRVQGPFAPDVIYAIALDRDADGKFDHVVGLKMGETPWHADVDGIEGAPRAQWKLNRSIRYAFGEVCEVRIPRASVELGPQLRIMLYTSVRGGSALGDRTEPLAVKMSEILVKPGLPAARERPVE